MLWFVGEHNYFGGVFRKCADCGYFMFDIMLNSDNRLTAKFCVKGLDYCLYLLLGMHEPEEMWRPPRNLRTWGRVLRICNRMNVLQKFAYNMSKGVVRKKSCCKFLKNWGLPSFRAQYYDSKICSCSYPSYMCEWVRLLAEVSTDEAGRIIFLLKLL